MPAKERQSWQNADLLARMRDMWQQGIAQAQQGK